MTIAMDGKTIRSTGHMDCYENPLHIVSAQISELGITFAQKSVAGKSNEIPAVQELIEQLEMADALALDLLEKRMVTDSERKKLYKGSVTVD